MLTTEQYIALLRPITEKWLATEAKALATASHPATASAYKGLMRTFADGALNEKVALLAGLPAPGPGPSPDPVPIPSVAGIDLTNWKITVDTDASGKITGEAREYYPILTDVPPAFIRNNSGSITFTARVDGATTSGSKYARSELREMKGKDRAAWKVSQGGILTATLSVNELPVKKDGGLGRVVIGQIHGPEDELCRLYFDNGKLYYVNDKSGTSMKEATFDLKDNTGKTSNIPLGDDFTYSISVKAGYLSVIVFDGNKTYSHSEKIGRFWTDDKGCYFKAGVYLGVGKESSGAGTIGTGQGSATFYGLKVSH